MMRISVKFKTNVYPTSRIRLCKKFNNDLYKNHHFSKRNISKLVLNFIFRFLDVSR